MSKDIFHNKSVLFCIDDNYLYPLLFCLYRIKKVSLKEPPVVVVYDPRELSVKSVRIIQNISLALNFDVSLIKITLPNLTESINHISNTAFLKCISLTLPSLPETFLISDVDVFFRKNWDSVWAILTEGKDSFFEGSGGVGGEFLTVALDRQKVDLLSKNSSIKNAHDYYFNSGIVLVNARAKPSNFSTQLIKNTLKKYNELGFEWKDQCVLNYLLTEHKVELPSKFNSFVVYPENKASGFILHFRGSVKKPWTIPLNPIRRFLYLNVKMFTGAYALYYRSEFSFLAKLFRFSPKLFLQIYNVRAKGVRKAPNFLFYFKAKARKITLRLFRRVAKKKVDEKLVSVGVGTYGADNLIIHKWDTNTRLVIGKYCSIADNISVYLGGNHNYHNISTFPFGSGDSLIGERIGHPCSNGDILIGNDVWIGSNASVMSGIVIGDGAVIAAHSHVVKDVRPYEIVGGNPARHIKYRFSSEVIDRLLNIRWWDLPETEILKIRDLLADNNKQKFWEYFGKRETKL